MQEYMKELKWNNSEYKVEKMIEEILNNSNFDYRDLILPNEGKEYWENCAKILVRLDNEKLTELLSELLVWFQDLNWPGGIIILNRLQELPTQTIEKSVLETIEKAILTKDYLWIEFLLYLNNIKTKKIINKILEYIEILDKELVAEIILWFEKLPEELKNNRVLELINANKV